MIKIIKNSRDPSHEMYVTTCDNCDCEFIFSESDTELRVYENTRAIAYTYTIECPCCGETCLMDNLEKYRGKRGGINGIKR